MRGDLSQGKKDEIGFGHQRNLKSGCRILFQKLIEETTWDNGSKEGFRPTGCDFGDRIQLAHDMM